MVMRLKLFLLLSAFSVWLYGIFNFYQIAQSISSTTTPVDGIVILTGGNQRIRTGLENVNDLNAARALISGVSKTVKISSMQRCQLQKHTHLLERIDIGYGAVNTFSNALEAAIWARTHQFKSIGLVTSRFHLPRSLWLFTKAMPEVRVSPVVVDANDSTFFHLLKEYHKYYLTKIVSAFLFEQENVPIL
jgi:uncharacterized SAM-binding protein YcdF (DUF218 family)